MIYENEPIEVRNHREKIENRKIPIELEIFVSRFNIFMKNIDHKKDVFDQIIKNVSLPFLFLLKINSHNCYKENNSDTMVFNDSNKYNY